MLAVLGCIAYDHNIWLVLVAAMVCAAGSWATIRLLYRAAATNGLQQVGWHFLTAVAAGSSIWCTHFIAMLAYDPGVPISLDPVLTIVSLLIAIAGSGLGFVITTLRWNLTPLIGGSILGLAISAMHYTGMLAYRVQGVVFWDMTYLIASIILSVAFSALAMKLALRQKSPRDKFLATGTLVFAIVSLHFTGMTAFQVSPMLIHGSFSNPAALEALALAVATVALIIVGAGLASYLIDDNLREESYQKLRRMALNDGLTGLPNRISFNEHLDHEIYLARETGGRFAVACIDLNGFKEINDLRGHSTGDKVLKALADRIHDLLQEGEFVARLGGDEFAAVHRTQDEGDLTDFLYRLEDALFDPIQLDDVEITPGASIGVAFYPDDADSKEALISNADLAMYRAKADLTKVTCFYERKMDETVRARRALATDLRKALEAEQLEVYYQIQTDIATQHTRGYEALLRWNHPKRGAIPPVEFIPLAEENGLILQLGEWVLRRACQDAAAWTQAYKVAVNLSPVQFAHACLPQLVEEILGETGLPAHRLELELTESTIIADKDRSSRMLQEIRALGVTIALDDFGTGYSSLETLRSFPFDKIKLDASFVRELETSQQAKAIIRAVLALGKSLDIPILAEGIETEGQLSLLSLEGCNEAQGYLLGRPAPLDTIIASGGITPLALPDKRQASQPSKSKDVATAATASIITEAQKA